MTEEKKIITRIEDGKVVTYIEDSSEDCTNKGRIEELLRMVLLETNLEDIQKDEICQHFLSLIIAEDLIK